MSDRTKKSLKIFGLFAMLIIVIISSSAFWNVMVAGTTVAGTFEIVVSIINFLVELGLLVHFGRKYLVQ